MIKAILDTNILISAVGWSGKPQKVLDYCIEDKFKLILSLQILNELKEVLSRQKFTFIEKEKKEELIILLFQLAEIHNIQENNINICRDKEDNKVIELAVFSKVDYIVSGDEDLLIIKEYAGIRIITVDKFLRVLEERRF